MFQAEINQLMSLIINAFYSNKEIFLRELIANASDALDKCRLSLLEQTGNVADLKIKLVTQKEARILEISDNGIGMTRQELIDNLGTIARSGTKQFIQSMSDTKDLSLIGQFGVGFYSAYLVADKVVVISRGLNEPDAYVWESNAGGSFTITKATEPMERGTRILVYLKEDQKDYLEESTLKLVIQKHCSFITYPIELEVHRNREVEEATEETTEDTKEETVEEVKTPPPKKTRTEAYTEWEQLNKQKPLWMSKPDEVTQDEYNTFYKSISTADWENPLATKHFSVEGQMEFRGILFVPKRAPFDMFGNEKRNHLKLYVRRIFITDNSDELVPHWLGFIKGVVDSDDLPLNVSREMLQQNRIMKVIQKNVVKKCIEMFSELAQDKPDDYKTFYENYSRNLKLGAYEDDKYHDKLVELLRFYSSKSEDSYTTLEDYVSRMKEDQTSIYYITGENLSQVRQSPFIEKLRKKGYEVLYMVDTIDEYLTQRLREYKNKKMVCVTKEGALLDDFSEDEKKERQETFKPVCDKIKEILGEKVEKVELSDRIVDTPAVLLTTQYGWSANMERIMKAQALNNDPMSQYMKSKKTMQINPEHRIVKGLVQRFNDPELAQASTTKDIVSMLYDSSLIHSGFGLEDPNLFVKRIHRMLELGLNLDEEPETQEEVPIEVKDEVKMEELD
jgi:molecular chaperone HtpG